MLVKRLEPAYSEFSFSPASSPTITPSNSEPESFSTTFVVAASGVSVAVIGVVLLVYFKKCNH